MTQSRRLSSLMTPPGSSAKRSQNLFNAAHRLIGNLFLFT